ncbi:peptide-methionine (S)-S-oxide reductase MsrA [Peptacetobacter sp.]|uniref:peptide-methionine (S)-S-oxide reductase MsrA n=1 Tax=Peptacetobacter sp. TaxID=2991975 RepID=UPI00260C6C4B|nr:peptide-methionine (S)-S-oxide reductase MsrA [Peptacetobacter sp.]
MIKKATFAGGCFWCMVKPFSKYDGILEVVSGYTGGEKENPTYREVCSGTTGHYEAIEITYDDDLINYKDILEVFWKQINPTDANGQFVDRGTQYRPAIFVHDDEQKNIAEESKKDLNESKRFSDPIVVEILDATVFYPAEIEHQDYYKKQPLHYNSYYKNSGRYNFVKAFWDGSRPDREELKNKLSDIEFEVTQNDMTECPFENEYFNHFEDGIYVDVVGGEALFSSKDKFECDCGWPSFSKPIEKNALLERTDFSMGMIRTEVRSRLSNSHLGHVFNDGPKNLGGLRYCINSAALKFIPKENLEEEGYSDYLKIFI